MTAHLPPDFRTIGIALGEHPMTSRWQRVTDIPEKDRGAAIALIMVGAVAPGTAISFDGDQLTRLAMIGAENYANNREHFDGMTVLDVGALAADMAVETALELAVHHPDILKTLARALPGKWWLS